MDTTLEMQLKTTGEQTLKVLKDLNGTMTGLITTLGKVKGATSGIENLGKVSDNASKKVDKLNSAFGKLFTLVGIKRIGTKALDFLGNATNRAEELNLFNVIFKNIEKNGVKTFSDLGLEATKFQHKLNESFGTNMTETMRYQGLYQAMATNQGIGEEYAKIMSENMLKLTYDLASLYNASESKTAEALRSGVFTGQVKPLRSFGVNVTEKSLNPVLASLGITDRTVSEMNQAEKQILRYIATLNQSKAAMGDFAETIESPANQLKIFKQQLVEAKTALGNLFMGVYSEVLPYANAFLMVVKEVAQAIADMFGIQASDYNSGLASQEEAFEGIEESAGKAAKSAKELKRQLLKFDEVNNLTTPSSSGSGSGSGLNNGGIDKRLLEAIKGYDNLMSKVRMKATEIRDRWMEILGFKKVINPLTGEVNFKYQGLKTTLKNLVNAFLNLNPQAKIFTALLAGITVTKIIAGIKKLSSVLGVSGLFKSITGLFTPLKTMSIYAKEIRTEMSSSVTGIKKYTSSWKDGIDSWYASANAMTKFKSGITGLISSIGGMALYKTALDDIAQSGINLLNVSEGLGGAFATIAGAVQLGASIGGSTGAIIGGVAGSIGLLIESISGLEYILDEDKQKFKELQKEVDNSYNEWQKSAERLSEAFGETDSTFDYYSRLYTELTNIVDENGKIKQGYEERATFITDELSKALGIEINIVDGVIQHYGTLKKSISDLIEQKKAMAKLNALEEEYTNALKEQGDARKRVVETYKEQQKAQKNLEDALDGYTHTLGVTLDELVDYIAYGEKSSKIQEILTGGYSLEYDVLKNLKTGYGDTGKKLKETTEAYENASKTLDGYNGIISTYEKMYGLALNNNYEAMNRYFDHERFLFGKSTVERQDYWKTVISDSNVGLEVLEKNQNKYTKEQYEALKKQYEDNIKLGQDYLNKLQIVTNTKNGEISEDVIKSWKDMGNKSTEEFLYFFDQLPTDAKTSLINGLEENKKDLSKDLQKVINDIKPTLTVDVNAKTSNANNTINSWVTQVTDKIKKALNAGFGGGVSGGRAMGGIYNGSSWSNIPQYANGGMPSHGTLFAAGENGAEIVGNINRRTEVLNRSQIASAIYNAVASAMSQYGGGTTQVELIAHTDEGVIIDKINQKTKQTGRCPIDMPAY